MHIHHEPDQAAPPSSSRPAPAKLDAQDLAALQAILPLITYQAGQRIFKFGDPGDTIYFIVSGKVKFFHVTPTGEELTLEEAGAGSFFGEVAMLHSGKRTASALALEQTTLLQLHSEELEAFLKYHPHVARMLMEGMAQRLTRSGEQLRYAPIRNANEVADQELTAQDKRVLRSTLFLGSGHFLIIFALIMLGWTLLNGWKSFDPGLGRLAILLSVVQIVIGNFVLNSQHRTAVQERALSKTEYEANILAEKEIRELHAKVEKQHSELLHYLHRIEKQQQTNDGLY